MSTTPKASRRPRGTYMSGQPSSTVLSRRLYQEDRQMEAWAAKRCDGTCKGAWSCAAMARRRRMHQLYARRTR